MAQAAARRRTQQRRVWRGARRRAAPATKPAGRGAADRAVCNPFLIAEIHCTCVFSGPLELATRHCENPAQAAVGVAGS